MTVNQPQSTPHQENETNATGPDLIDILRSQAEPEILRDGQFEELLKNIEEKLVQTVSAFASQDIELRIAEFEEFKFFSRLIIKSADGTSTGGSNTIIRDEESNVFSVFNMASAQFHQFISMVVGRGEYSPVIQLSAGQNRLLLQFSHQIALTLNETLQLNNEIVSPVLTDEVALEEEISVENLGLLAIEFVMAGKTFIFNILLPRDYFQLDNDDTNIAGTQGIAKKYEEIWRSKLRLRISELPVPLLLQFGASDMRLSEIENLKNGSILDVVVDMNHVRICDVEGVCDFYSDVDLHEDEIQLRITRKCA